MQEKSSPRLFGDLLALARQSWVEQMARRLEQRGYADYRRSDAGALRLIARAETMTLGELGQALGVTRQAARKLVTALERRGFARTVPDPDDGRRMNVVLTDAGQRYARAVTEVVAELNSEFSARVAPEDLEAARRVLRAALGSWTPEIPT